MTTGVLMGEGERNKRLVRRFIDALNERELAALDDIVATDFVRRCQATPDVEVRSLADFRRFVEQDMAVFPDSRVTVETLVAEGDLVAFFAQYQGTQEGAMGRFPPSGKRTTVDFAGMFRIEDGRIAELRLTWDNLSILMQLGHLNFS